jgi:hypothetical protein
MISEDQLSRIIDGCDYAERVEEFEQILGSVKVSKLAAAKWNELARLIEVNALAPHELLFLPPEIWLENQ